MSARKPGKVWLVGAGPGDPELLTLKAVRALGEAQVVLVDDLVNRAVLVHARPDARIVEVGKRGGCRSTPQAFIERLMVRYAQRGYTVARLKGGDPFVFGRAGEEIEALAAAGIPCEVVSGITAGLAAAATQCIPVTHRGAAHGVIFVTAHLRDGAEPDWAALGRTNLTLVVYMGVGRLASICSQLMASGRAAETPVALVQHASLPGERSVTGTLADIAETAAAGRFVSPSIIIIGDVVAARAAIPVHNLAQAA